MSRLRWSSTLAGAGRKATPRRASGIERDDDQGVEDDGRQDRALRRRQAHDVERVQLRVDRDEHRRQDREVLGDVVGDRERRDRAARDEQLLADRDDLEQLRRIGVEVDHVGRLLGRRRPAVHRQARRRTGRAPARRSCRRRSSRRGGLRPARPRMKPIFASGVASAMKSSTPASRAIVAAVRGLSPVIITVRMPIRRNSANRSTRPSLTVSLSSISAEDPAVDRGWRAASRPASAIRSVAASDLGRHGAVEAGCDRVDGALQDRVAPAAVRTPLVRVSARNGISSAIVGGELGEAGSSSVPPGCSSSASRLRARSTIERPSGVSSWIDETSAAVDRLASVDAGGRRDRRQPAGCRR